MGSANMKRGLATLADVDERRDEHQRERDNHPVLKRDAEKRDLPCQPVLHQASEELTKALFVGG